MFVAGEVLHVDVGGTIEVLSWERLNHMTGGAVFGTLTSAQIQWVVCELLWKSMNYLTLTHYAFDLIPPRDSRRKNITEPNFSTPHWQFDLTCSPTDLCPCAFHNKTTKQSRRGTEKVTNTHHSGDESTSKHRHKTSLTCDYAQSKNEQNEQRQSADVAAV